MLHLAEVLHQASLEHRLGVAGLVKWLAEQAGDGPERDEALQLRLETDEQAAKVVTIHRSKGLEYPVVFVPFSWKGSEIKPDRDGHFTFHSSETGEPTLHLGGEPVGDHLRLASRERLAENVRLLYVALTRAQHRCCFVWGGFNHAETSAAAWVLHPPPEVSPEDPVAALKTHCGSLDDPAMRSDLAALVARSKGANGGATIAVRDLPGQIAERYRPREETVRRRASRHFAGVIQRDWRIASFSSLTAGREAERPDHDEAGPPPAAETPTAGMFAFPRGLKAGTCLHKILERLDFTQWRQPATRELVAEELLAHGVPPAEFAGVVCEMIGNVMTARLEVAQASKSRSASLALGEIPMGSRLNELEFCFPLQRLSAAGLLALWTRHGAADDSNRLTFSPVTGMLKGFIDLVFEWQGRFWIVDWKSNWLGNRVEDYHPAALREEMRRRHYQFQYQLYTVALDKYLRLRMPGYSYEKHFGGVFYLFLRGLDPTRPGLGIFHDRPSPALVSALGELLAGPASPQNDSA